MAMTSRRRPVKLSMTYGWADGTVGWAKAPPSFPGGTAPDGAVGIVDLRQRLLQRDVAVVELDPDRVGHLGEEADPPRPGGDALLGEHLLLGLREQVRAEAAGGLEEVSPTGQSGRVE